MAGGYQIGTSGPSISDSEGKMTFPWLFILGRHQEECRSSCSIPAGRSDPVNSRLPLQQLSLRSSKGLAVSKRRDVYMNPHQDH